jgi:hypothetical protein
MIVNSRQRSLAMLIAQSDVTGNLNYLQNGHYTKKEYPLTFYFFFITSSLENNCFLSMMNFNI